MLSYCSPAVALEEPAGSGPAEEPEPVCAARGLEESRLCSQRGVSQSQADHIQLLPARSSPHGPRRWGYHCSRISQQYRHK